MDFGLAVGGVTSQVGKTIVQGPGIRMESFGVAVLLNEPRTPQEDKRYAILGYIYI